MAASPSFSINSNPVNTKASITEATAVVATLDSTDGVRQVLWIITRVDETSLVTDYVLVQSGTVGETVSTTSLGQGTAAVLRAQINGGLDEQTDAPSNNTRREVKFFVPAAGGIEVLAAGEFDDDDFVSSATHGAIDPVNKSLRSSAAGRTFKDAVRTITAGALPANTRIVNTREADVNGTLTIDTVLMVVGDDFLDKNEGAGEDRGIWTVTDAGSGSTKWKATRRSDFDSGAEVRSGSIIPSSGEGGANGSKLAILTTANDITINTTSLMFAIL